MRLAGKQEKKSLSWGCSKESLTVWARWEKHPREHPSSFSASENRNTSQLFCGHMNRDERGPSEHTSPASLTNIKANILQSCELSANWCLLSEEWQQQPECVWETCVRQKAKKILTCVCVCMCQQQVWFSPLFSWNTYFTQGMQHMSCMLTLRGRRRTETHDYMEAHEGKLVSGSQTQMEFWPFNCHN